MSPDVTAELAAEIVSLCARIETAFREIDRSRMRELGLCHPGLRVEAVGFAPDNGEPAVAVGVLVTPWSMNLLRLALNPAAQVALAEFGHKRRRTVCGRSIEFLGSLEPAVGRFEACSLFSPMGGFADHDTAVATASEVLRLLREPAGEAPSTDTTTQPMAEPLADRRRFLLGDARRPAAPPPRPESSPGPPCRLPTPTR